MDYDKLKSVIEGLLFLAGDEGLDAKQIGEIIELPEDTVVDLIEDMKADFRRQGRGIQIVEVARAYQFTTLQEHAPYFERMASSPGHSTLSQAALETLAIIAYKQPITRSEIEEIRGVKCEKALNTLLSKQLIRETGRAEGIGRPILYGTTKEFLEHFGLRQLTDLPAAPEGLSVEEAENEVAALFAKASANDVAPE
ncbi:SMC-Scp complex subunit ScpB [Brevibacillus sp. B_LB10_24]|uniref:SMC-Scp complex subunit ScpB n=1 Tax=Brevibacillus sp. B_LB10_24 TaxID=3380645 RepID=UPI0038BB8501